MKKTFLVIASALVFLFFIQSAGSLVESIYILDLMNTNLDARVLGLLFFFTPLLLIPFLRKFQSALIWIIFTILFAARSLFPYLQTVDRMLVSGVATGASLCLFMLLIGVIPHGKDSHDNGWWLASGLALAVGLSVLLRTAYFGVDYSLTPAGGWTGILLGLALGWALTRLEIRFRHDKTGKRISVTASLLGMFLIITLMYFSFSAPAVIARWTEGNYTFIVLAVSLLACGWVLVSFWKPELFQRISKRTLLILNLAFTFCLTATILFHAVPFPPTPSSPAVTIGAPAWWQAVPLVLMLLLFPVLFIDMDRLASNVLAASASPEQLIPGFLLGSLTLVVLVFFNIFSNVWGYVEPVSGFFRGKFWLAFFLPAIGISLLAWGLRKKQISETSQRTPGFHWAWGLALALLFVGTLVRAVPGKKVQEQASGRTSIKVMTYNIQAGNDGDAQKSFERQLALIRQVSPDILSMQETDTARISLNNSDYVRFFAESLGYYSYYGPTTVTGTFGTAILSKFPLEDTSSVFTYSDTDEIGVAEAVVNVDGHAINIYDVHPDGSETAKMVFAQALLERMHGQVYAIALGDYNLRDYEAPYQLIDSVLTNAWTRVYPSKISPDGVDMSGKNRIDHIFFTPALSAENPVYLLPPASATDHPVHWAEISWGNP
jgi:endonuclease/exonuclease/phosphatase family metal-dependent hydrolase